jgi:transposase-like protein
MTKTMPNQKEQFNAFRFKDLNDSFSKNQNIASFSLIHTHYNGRECPHCKSHNVVSKGNYRNRKRYKCKDCGKSYNDLTGTSFSGIHNLDKMMKYIGYMFSGMSVRKAAKAVGICRYTSFQWRHKVLDSLIKLPSPRMKNVKELMEVKMPYSHKGQRTELTEELRSSIISAIFVCDRFNKLDSDCIVMENRAKNPIFDRIRQDATIHTEIICPPILQDVLKDSPASIRHPLPPPPTTTTTIQHSITTWKTWMKRFRGVASKYLANYLHWFDFLENTLFNPQKIPEKHLPNAKTYLIF